MTTKIKIPTVGQYGEVYYDDISQKHKTRLTEKGKIAVEEYLKKYPHPIALLKSKWSRLYCQALAIGINDDDLDCLCKSAMVKGFIKFNPELGGITTVVTWCTRGEICEAIRSRLPIDRKEINGYEGWDKKIGKGSDSCDHWDIPEYLSKAKLNSSELLSLTLKFGLDDNEPTTDKKIAERLNVSQEWVRKIVEKAIYKLRYSLDVDGDNENKIIDCLKLSILETKPEICRKMNMGAGEFRKAVNLLVSRGIVGYRRVKVKGKVRTVYHLSKELAK